MSEIDPITLEVLWSRLRGIPQEMGEHLRRTAFSAVMKYSDDFSTCLFTADGRLLAQGVYTPGHLGSMPFTLRSLLDDHFGIDEWEPGDVVLTNNPYINSGHLPDLIMYEPAFVDGDLVGFSATTGHHVDVGGPAPGSYTMRVSDMHGEGLQLPPLKFVEGGELNDEVLDIITENSREPKKIRGDVHAQRNANRTGVELYQELIEEFGAETVKRYEETILERTEQAMREAIRELPNGTYDFEDKLDGFEEPLPVRVEVAVEDDEITIDFTGTAPQQQHYAINSPRNYTFSYVMMAIKSIVDPDTPQTHGTIEPIQMNAPERTIVNPRPPVPVASRQLLSNRIVSAINGALYEAVPEAIPASGAQLFRGSIKFTDPETGEQKILQDRIYGGAGAWATRDGFPAVSGDTNVKNIPVEVIEREYPVRIARYELVPDSAGPGRYRGGSATQRVYEFDRSAELQFCNDRFRFGPYGLGGGQSGQTGRAIVNPDTAAETNLSSTAEYEIEENDVLHLYTCGGGGYGPPKERADDAVRKDVRNGLVSAAQAREVYGADGEWATDGGMEE